MIHITRNLSIDPSTLSVYRGNKILIKKEVYREETALKLKRCYIIYDGKEPIGAGVFVKKYEAFAEGAGESETIIIIPGYVIYAYAERGCFGNDERGCIEVNKRRIGVYRAPKNFKIDDKVIEELRNGTFRIDVDKLELLKEINF